MRRIVLGLSSTVMLLVLLFSYRTSTAGPLATLAAGSSYGTGTLTPGQLQQSRPASNGTKKVVTGPVAQTRWGPVQVKVTFGGSVITAVDVLQYPTGNSTDAQINSYALPLLVKATLTKQSATIDMISGATVTSTGYLQSLQAALDQAAL